MVRRSGFQVGCGAFGLLAAAALVMLLITPSAGRASFPGANGRIYFTSTRAAAAPDIWSMNPDGSDPLQLTSHVDHDSNPAVSADGRTIAFRSDRDGQPEIYRANAADGSNQVRLTNDAGSDDDMSWSPDGTRIVWVSTRVPEGMYIMNADNGSNPTFFMEGDDPAWSPDGTKIAFSFDDNGSENHIYVVNAAGGTPLQLTDDVGGDNDDPNWSPDGTKILFVSTRDGDSDAFVMNANGSGETNFTPGALGVADPVWSPDGSKIAFADGSTNEVMVMDADGSDAGAITSDGTTNENLDWGVLPIAPTDTPSPSPTPTASPSPTPSATPTASPTATPLATPTSTTPAPSTTPSPSPTSNGQPVLWGNSDCDESISSRDNQALLRKVLDQSALSQTKPCPDLGDTVTVNGVSRLWGDWDCDGEISSRDNQALLRNVLSQVALSQTEPCPDIGSATQLFT